MAQDKELVPEQSLAPVLLAPRREMVVEGTSVTFLWAPIRGISSYRLEVATDASFEHVVFDHEVGQRTNFHVQNVFGEDGTLYYWRVLADDAAGLTHGVDTIQSFIGGTADEAAQHISRPDEGMGPYPELIKGAALEAAAELTQDENLFRREVAMGVAHESIEAGQILGLVLAVAVAIVALVVFLFQYTGFTEQRVLGSVVGLSGYPELRETRLAATRQLTQYDVVDDQARVFRVPIERAIDLMVDENRTREGGAYTGELQLLPRAVAPVPTVSPAPEASEGQ